MKERPILFTGPMVRAILDGRKTVTRRPIKPDWWRCLDPDDEEDRVRALAQCPYGVRGDRLWVREAFTGPVLCADNDGYLVERFFYRATDERQRNHRGELIGWRPSIHMPREASRLLLRIVGVRYERLQEITEEDARAEGVERRREREEPRPEDWHTGYAPPLMSYVGSYADLWDSINAKRGFPWSSSPWVWVVTFKKVEG